MSRADGGAADGGAVRDGGAGDGGSGDGGVGDGGTGLFDNRALFVAYSGEVAHEFDPAARAALTDRFFADVNASGGFPIRGGNDVTFVYRGRVVEGVAPYVAGSFNDWNPRALRMFPLSEPDVWAAAVEVGADTRIDYQFVDGARTFADPHNALVSWHPGASPLPGELRSVVLMPAHRAQSGVLRFERGARNRYIYLPAATLRGEVPRPPALYVQDGLEAVTEGELDAVAEGLIAQGAIVPLALVFVEADSQRRTFDYTTGPSTGGNAYVDSLRTQLAPDLERRLSLSTSDRGVAGVTYGGLVSFHAARRAPGFWTRVGALSPAFDWDRGRIVSDYRDGEVVPGRFYFDISSSEPGAADARAMRDAMAAKGYAHTFVEHDDASAPDWDAWHERFAAMLRALYPVTANDGGL